LDFSIDSKNDIFDTSNLEKEFIFKGGILYSILLLAFLIKEDL